MSSQAAIALHASRDNRSAGHRCTSSGIPEHAQISGTTPSGPRHRESLESPSQCISPCPRRRDPRVRSHRVRGDGSRRVPPAVPARCARAGVLGRGGRHAGDVGGGHPQGVGGGRSGGPWLDWAVQFVPAASLEAVTAWFDAGQPDPDRAADRIALVVRSAIQAACAVD